MGRRIAAYSLFVLGLLTFTFFRYYTGRIIPHPFLLWFLGLTMFLGGYLLLRYTPSAKDQAARQQLRQMIGALKANGEKIRVDLRSCEVREHNYTERRNPAADESLLMTLTAPGTLHSLLNQLEDKDYGKSMREVVQSVLIFPYANSRTGQAEKFISQVISKDRVTLSFYLDKQQHTTLYIDKTDRNLYFFDLDFLTVHP